MTSPCDDGPISAPDGAPWLALFAARMEAHRVADGFAPQRSAVCTGERIFYCDGGALLGAVVAEDLGLPFALEVGLYWHSDPALRADLMGEEDPSEDDLAHIQARSMDEHHHWVELTGSEGWTWLFDPNGPVRREPYFQELTSQVRDRYCPMRVDDPWRTAVIDPDDDHLSQLREYYPASADALVRSDTRAPGPTRSGS